MTERDFIHNDFKGLTDKAERFFEASDSTALVELFGQCKTVEDVNNTAEELYDEFFEWYAVMCDSNDNDWGYGSYNLMEAKNMAEAMGNEAYIAVIIGRGTNKICENEIIRENGEWSE